MDEYDKPGDIPESLPHDFPAEIPSTNEYPKDPQAVNPQPVNPQPINPQPVYQQTPSYQPPVYQAPVYQPPVYQTPIVPPVYTQYIRAEPIITNQVVITPPTKFSTKQMAMLCPFCKNYINTKVSKSISILNCCCCCCTSPIIWAGFQYIRGKDLICCNAKHTCPRCGATLGRYDAC